MDDRSGDSTDRPQLSFGEKEMKIKMKIWLALAISFASGQALAGSCLSNHPPRGSGYAAILGYGALERWQF